MDVSKSICDRGRNLFSFFFLEMKGECKVSCLKLVAWSIVAQKGTNILSFYIFEYGAEYGAEYYILVINSISCCSYRYAMSHALSVWHTHCLRCTRRKILGRSHIHFPIFSNIILKHLVLRFFLKPDFKECIPF